GGTEIGRNLYEEIKGGYTDKMSFGFTVAKDHKFFDGDAYVRSIDAIGKLYDVSAVSLPQNNNTEIYSARKHIDGVIDELETERARAEEERRMLEAKKENLVAKLKSLRKD
ncbi:MAG: HK97 family phage prohead protease, partial [Aeriscardovia sp.]|nr:HK97 family phage prohead protease [Aeriscardovia sp.]